MEKRNQFIVWGVLIVLFVFIWIWIFLYPNNTELSPVVDKDLSLIEKNYIPEFHHLALNSKELWDIPDLCGLAQNTKYVANIWSIDLSNNGIQKIDQDLSCFWNLSDLNLSFNKISKIENLEKLNFLKKLDLWNNKLNEISWLSNLLSLQELHLWYNQLTSTEWLESLNTLWKLKLQHNSLSDIKNIEKLTQLTELKLEFNQLDNSDIQILKNLKNLKIITLAENKEINESTIKQLNEFSLKNMSSSWVVQY